MGEDRIEVTACTFEWLLCLSDLGVGNHSRRIPIDLPLALLDHK